MKRFHFSYIRQYSKEPVNDECGSVTSNFRLFKVVKTNEVLLAQYNSGLTYNTNSVSLGRWNLALKQVMIPKMYISINILYLNEESVMSM